MKNLESLSKRKGVYGCVFLNRWANSEQKRKVLKIFCGENKMFWCDINSSSSSGEGKEHLRGWSWERTE